MLDGQAGDSRVLPSTERFEIRFPAGRQAVDQDEEWCEVGLNGSSRRFRFHDYADIYSVPGLYEQLFYEELECRSPQTVARLLRDELAREGGALADLAVLDIGAGNGMVGEQLARLGARSIVGVDIIEEAARAARRDRPDVYADYFVVDLTAIPAQTRDELERRRFNCLTSVAALGFGDIPPLAFAEAHNLVADGGWIAFTIKEEFLGAADGTGFSRLIRRMLDDGTLELRGERRYRHRLSAAGEALHYVAMVARKQRAVPLEWAERLSD